MWEQPAEKNILNKDEVKVGWIKTEWIEASEFLIFTKHNQAVEIKGYETLQ
jgi:hypothetical protein